MGGQSTGRKEPGRRSRSFGGVGGKKHEKEREGLKERKRFDKEKSCLSLGEKFFWSGLAFQKRKLK